MKVKMMRRLDYYTGVPLCLMATFLYKIKKLFVKKSSIGNPQKVVFIKLLGLGSIVLTKPAVQETKSRYPNSEFFFITFKSNHGIFDILSVIPNENLLLIDQSSLIKLIKSLADILKRLKKEKIDVVVDFEFFSRFTALLSFLIRSKYRVGFFNHYNKELNRGDFLTHKVYFNSHQHIACSYMALIESFCYQPHQQFFFKDELRVEDLYLSKVKIDNLEKVAVFQRLKQQNGKICDADKMIVVNPNASDINKRLGSWPLHYHVELANLILDNMEDAVIVYVGAEKEKGVIKSVTEQIVKKDRVIDYTGNSLRDFVVLLSLATVFVTNDTGPMHVASLAEVDMISFFGPGSLHFTPLTKNSTNLVSGLICQPCQTIVNGRRSKCRDNQCLKRITPKRVFDIIKEKYGKQQS